MVTQWELLLSPGDPPGPPAATTGNGFARACLRGHGPRRERGCLAPRWASPSRDPFCPCTCCTERRCRGVTFLGSVLWSGSCVVCMQLQTRMRRHVALPSWLSRPHGLLSLGACGPRARTSVRRDVRMVDSQVPPGRHGALLRLPSPGWPLSQGTALPPDLGPPGGLRKWLDPGLTARSGPKPTSSLIVTPGITSHSLSPKPVVASWSGFAPWGQWVTSGDSCGRHHTGGEGATGI